MRPLTRRRMLAILLGGAGLATLFYAVRDRLRQLPLVGSLIPPPQGSTGPIAKHAFPALVALGDVLIPVAFSTAGTSRHRTAVSSVLRTSLEDSARRLPDFHADCEAVAQLLDRAARAENHTDFAGLQFARRQGLAAQLLQRNSSGDSPRGSPKPLTTVPRESTQVHRVTQTLIHGFYVSRYGWISLGYTRGRGECSDLNDYQSPPRPA